MPRKVHAALMIALVASAGLAAAQVTVPRLTHTAPATTQPIAPLAHGMMIAVDPETGQLGPGIAGDADRPATIEAAQAYAREIAATLVTVTHADGSQSLIHDDRLADYAVIRMTPDGRPVMSCVEGAAAAAATLKQPVLDANGLEVE
jgi:hypothetical protein